MSNQSGEIAVLETWVEAGWIVRREGGGFAAGDLARAALIRDLREELGVNDEGVAVILDLLDQLHGTRRALRRLAERVGSLPEPIRSQVWAALRERG